MGDDAGELPPALDFEIAEGLPAHVLIERAQKWLAIVGTALHCKPVVYSSASFWSDSLKNWDGLRAHALWTAHYTQANNPHIPSVWPSWTLWQHSQDGTVPGIEGKVDLDRFNGTLSDLAAFCALRGEMEVGTSA